MAASSQWIEFWKHRDRPHASLARIARITLNDSRHEIPPASIPFMHMNIPQVAAGTMPALARTQLAHGRQGAGLLALNLRSVDNRPRTETPRLDIRPHSVAPPHPFSRDLHGPVAGFVPRRIFGQPGITNCTAKGLPFGGKVPLGESRPVPAAGFVPRRIFGHPSSSGVSGPYANREPRLFREQVGRPLAAGGEATVYLHGRDPNTVIKVFRDGISHADRNNELTTLNRYYGEAFASSDGDSIMMKRIAGAPLHKIPPRSLPSSAMDELHRVLERFQEVGIWPTDLCEANFLYAPSQGIISPIDLKDAQIDRRSGADLRRYAESYRGGVANLHRVLLDKIRPDTPLRR